VRAADVAVVAVVPVVDDDAEPAGWPLVDGLAEPVPDWAAERPEVFVDDEGDVPLVELAEELEVGVVPDLAFGEVVEAGPESVPDLGAGCALGAGCDVGAGCDLGVGCALGVGCDLGAGCVVGLDVPVDGPVAVVVEGADDPAAGGAGEGASSLCAARPVAPAPQLALAAAVVAAVVLLAAPEAAGAAPSSPQSASATPVVLRLVRAIAKTAPTRPRPNARPG